MTATKDSLVFLSGKRTPFGTNGGALKDVMPADLGITAAKAAIEQSGVPADQIDHVIFGNVLHSAADSIYVPRHVGLRSGVPEAVPALGINRLCGSGFQVIIEAWHQFLAGDSKVALVGGVENMSMTPYALRSARWGYKMGHAQACDMLTEAMTDTYAQAPMAITAENLAAQYGITRQQCDEFALASQQKFRKAQEELRFKNEIVPFGIKDRKGNLTVMDQDEHPRHETTMESLGKLKPVFKKDGVVTAGNASGIVDGAAAMVVTTESHARKQGWKPLARLVAYGISGCDPKIMGIGPVPASREALKRAGMTLDQMDLIEINEAFAPQALAVAQELKISSDRLNGSGGAIAVGHPLAASGTRITQHLIYELARTKKKYALGSACIGGGQGIAVIVESLA